MNGVDTLGRPPRPPLGFSPLGPPGALPSSGGSIGPPAYSGNGPLGPPLSNGPNGFRPIGPVPSPVGPKISGTISPRPLGPPSTAQLSAMRPPVFAPPRTAGPPLTPSARVAPGAVTPLRPPALTNGIHSHASSRAGTPNSIVSGTADISTQPPVGQPMMKQALGGPITPASEAAPVTSPTMSIVPVVGSSGSAGPTGVPLTAALAPVSSVQHPQFTPARSMPVTTSGTGLTPSGFPHSISQPNLGSQVTPGQLPPTPGSALSQSPSLSTIPVQGTPSMPAFNVRYPSGAISAQRTPGPPAVSGQNVLVPPGPPAPATPVVTMFSSSSTGTPLVNNFGAPSPATAFGTPSLLSNQGTVPRPPLSGPPAAAPSGPPQPSPALPSSAAAVPLALQQPAATQRPGGILRPRYPASTTQHGQQAPQPGNFAPPPPMGQQPQAQPRLQPQQINGITAATTLNGPTQPQAPFYPGDNRPPMTMTGGLPPTPLQLNGPQPPQPIGGMPPMPPVNGPMAVGQSRFGGSDVNSLGASLGGLSVTQTGFQKMWGMETVDLLSNRHILPPEEVHPPRPKLQAEAWNSINCSTDIFRCTLSKIPETEALLKKARLPLGVLIHPFKDLSHLPVIQCSTIVRCRSCRTYINPFVHFVDQRRWRCNLCYRVNELPEEFLYDPVSKSYGDPSRRPECRSATIEFIAPQEYMLRPPQPAIYLFLLDVSRQALECGYLRNFCEILMDELDKLPGDARTQIGFITYHRTIQFYMIPEGASQASQLVVGDVDDIFLPSPCDLLVNLQSCKEQIVQMLSDLPELFNGSQETDSCLGSALQAAYKMVSPTGGRITVVQATLPNIGPGSLKAREGTQGKETNDISLLGPSTDFYKKLALDCSGQQVAVDCFVLNNQHVDLATISGISKFSGGQIQTFPGYHNHQNIPQAEKFDRSLRRYLTRKIGFEAVMRIRCTRGMSLHTFHGHFFVRSTDLLSLPNVNPDAGFGMQVSIDEDLKDSREVSFQAALLYTSSRGERRIRVHTLCIPTSANLQEIIQGSDQQCIVGLLAKMAVDRTLNSSLQDAREAFINVCVDTVSRWKLLQCISQPGVLPVSSSLRLLALYILALLKSPAFTPRPGIRLDDRTASLIDMKCLPLTQLLQSVYPDLYRVDNLDICKTQEDEEGVVTPNPPRLQLSAEHVALSGVYLMDVGDFFYLYVGKVAPQFFCEKIFNVSKVSEIDENITELPELDNEDSERLRTFIQFLNNKKSHSAPLRIVKDDSKSRFHFIQLLVDDRSESSFSYYEFLQHLKTQIK